MCVRIYSKLPPQPDSKQTDYPAMAALHEAQIRAQAIALLEEKYSYSVIAKKLGRCTSWIIKWANRYKQNPNETLHSRYQ